MKEAPVAVRATPQRGIVANGHRSGSGKLIAPEKLIPFEEDYKDF
jgi:hypothetical protein